MQQAVVTINLVAPYCQSRFHDTPKLNKELAEDYERRTWKDKLHVVDGEVVIPGMAFANCIKECAKFLGIQIPGKKQSTWTKHFEAGIVVPDDVRTGVAVSKVIEKQMFVPSNGIKGSGKRVMKSYPLITPPVKFKVHFYVTDELITPEVFALHLQQAGLLIGIGAFRVRNGGVFGRFDVETVEWTGKNSVMALPEIRKVG